MANNLTPIRSGAPKSTLEKWLLERVTVCDQLQDETPSPALKARADAFREALEMLWELNPEAAPVCRVCGKEMGRSRSGRLTCSVRCRVAAHRAG